MPRNTLVINCDVRETRVALIEGGVIAELQIERAHAKSTVGNVVLGRVTRVLPGMQAAFIDVGLDRAAFLHVEDLIRPDDFESYLSGGRGEDAGERWKKGEGGRRRAHSPAQAEEEEEDDEEDEEDEEAEGEDDDPNAEEEEEEEEEEDEEDDPEGGTEELADADREDESEVEASTGALQAETVTTSTKRRVRAVASTADNTDDAGARRRRRRRRRRGQRPERPERAEATPARSSPARVATPTRVDPARRTSRDSKVVRSPGRSAPSTRDTRRSKLTARAARAVPITEVVKEGDEVIVQISKEPLGTKGARVTSHISLPGRYVVYLPTVDHVGVSKRIGSAKERARLREVVETLRPPTGGLIVRTVAEGLTKKALKADIGYLVKLWEDVSRKRENAKAPSVLYTELDLVLKTARDLFTDEIESIVIDDREQYGRLLRFVEMFMPNRAKDVHYYSGDEPIFDAYGIEDEIARALSRKVPLSSGGYLVIDQAEALTAIDVNTGRYVGKGSKDLEETALKTNLEAVDEIAYQLRFRNIGGLVILDLIDMDHPGNRERVWKALEQRLAKDKAKTTINRISELGLIEMTRKRTRESLHRTMHETCFYCDGTGQVQSRTTIAYEILRQIRRERHSLPGYSVLVNAHPAVVDLMAGEEKAAVQEAERRYMRRIDFSPRPEYHIEQFDLQGK